MDDRTDDTAAELTVMTWNLHGSAGPDLDRVADELRRSGATWVGLQEVRRSQARRLGTRLGWNVRWVFKHAPMTPLVWWLAEGMAILSPHPLSAAGSAVLMPGASRSSYRRRVVQWATVEAPGGPCRALNVHLAAHRDGRTERVDQARRVAALVTDDTVLTGDLNAADEPDVLAPLVDAGLADAWSRDDPGFTNPAGRASQRLDYVMAGRAFATVATDVPPDGPGWAAVSDHLPVEARLRRAPLS